jgi:hypothetical protein
MRQHTVFVSLALVTLVAGRASAQHGPVLPPFSGTITRLPAPGQISTLVQPPPAAPGGEAALTSISTPKPDFDVYTKDNITGDGSQISPALAFGYKNLRSANHPWAVEGGYKNVDASTGRQDLWLGTAWATAWTRGTDANSQSITFEEDGSRLAGSQTRFDSYAIAEAARSRVTVDVMVGVTTARNVGAAQITDLLAGVLPNVQLVAGFSAQGLYSIKNDVDGEDYYEIGLTRSFTRLAFQLSVAVAKHGTYAVRFQKTLKHATRPLQDVSRR